MTSSSEETEENHNSIPTGIPQESQILAVGMRSRYSEALTTNVDYQDFLAGGCSVACGPIRQLAPVAFASSIMPSAPAVKVIMHRCAWKMTCDFGPVMALLTIK